MCMVATNAIGWSAERSASSQDAIGSIPVLAASFPTGMAGVIVM